MLINPPHAPSGCSLSASPLSVSHLDGKQGPGQGWWGRFPGNGFEGRRKHRQWTRSGPSLSQRGFLRAGAACEAGEAPLTSPFAHPKCPDPFAAGMLGHSVPPGPCAPVLCGMAWCDMARCGMFVVGRGKTHLYVATSRLRDILRCMSCCLSSRTWAIWTRSACFSCSRASMAS